MTKKKPRGRPRVSKKMALGKVVAVRLTSDLLGRLDRWRLAKPSAPSRSQAVRQITEDALSDSEIDRGK
jgi:metal-responsive CopG/Arc/MetJ family transcriptional regulator